MVLRRRAPLPENLPRPLSSSELGERYSADPADLDAVRAAVRDAGAEVVNVDQASRRIRVAGPTTVLESLFGTNLSMVQAPDPASGQERSVRIREGELSVPASLAGVIIAVLRA